MTTDNGQNGATPTSGGERGETGLVAHKDASLEGRALRERWPITDEMRRAIVNRQATIAIDPKSANRSSTAAARVLVSMEGQNQADAPAAQQINHLHANLQDVLAEIGEDEVYVEAARSIARLRDAGDMGISGGQEVEVRPPSGAGGSGNNGHDQRDNGSAAGD